MDPLGVTNNRGTMGNLMGPNLPAFHQGRPQQQQPPNDDPAYLGFGGMRPRFDSFGSPGGPADIDTTNNGLPPPPTGPPRRGFPGGSGNPNQDHLRPPNNLNNNNMFL
jgi:hypothetical protein